MATDQMAEMNNEMDRVRRELKQDVDKETYIFVGPGAERKYGTGSTRLRAIVAELRDEDNYVTHYVEMEHPDSEEPKMILVKVLTKRETNEQQVWLHRSRILKMWLDAQIAPTA